MQVGEPTHAQPDAWIALELRTNDGRPVPFARYRIIEPSGDTHEGLLDQHGRIRVALTAAGTCRVTFPELAAKSWRHERGS